MQDQNRPVSAEDRSIPWLQVSPFVLLHVAPLGLLWTGVALRDVILCVALYVVRMFFITAGYHRYFAHRAYKMGRVMQFLMAFGGSTAVQKGVLWWASHHRWHHKYSDAPEDVHSPQDGLWWSHVGWILSRRWSETDYDKIRDMAKYPELRWLNRYHLVPPTLLAIGVFLYGGLSALLCGFFLSTALLYHGTFTINSLCHVFGKRRFPTTDTSKNSLVLALITLGEGWHNNHHYYQTTANQGFYWWEIDISYYVLRALAAVGLVSDLRRPPQRILDEGLAGTAPPQERVRRPVPALSNDPGLGVLHPEESESSSAALST